MKFNTKKFNTKLFKRSRLTLLGLAIAWLGACTSSPSNQADFTWYHPQGGEYLFAFDQGECEHEVLTQGQRLGTNIQGPFFSCMTQRGYSLLDGQDRLLSAVDENVTPAPVVSQQ